MTIEHNSGSEHIFSQSEMKFDHLIHSKLLRLVITSVAILAAAALFEKADKIPESSHESSYPNSLSPESRLHPCELNISKLIETPEDMLKNVRKLEHFHACNPDIPFSRDFIHHLNSLLSKNLRSEDEIIKNIQIHFQQVDYWMIDTDDDSYAEFIITPQGTSTNQDVFIPNFDENGNCWRLKEDIPDFKKQVRMVLDQDRNPVVKITGDTVEVKVEVYAFQRNERKQFYEIAHKPIEMWININDLKPVLKENVPKDTD